MTHPTVWRSGGDRGPRLLVLAGLAAFVGSVYGAVVVGGGALTGSPGSPPVALSVLATAIVALGFEPVRQRLDRLVRRLTPRAGESPYEVLSRFADDVTAGWSGEELPLRMARVLAEGTGARWAQVWLVVNGRLTLAATWPATEDADRTAPSPATASAGTASLPVRHGGDLLGVLRLQERERRPLTPAAERLFAGLAAQAGLVLRQTRLRTELAERLAELSERTEELQLSRKRLVQTQDEERRSLERDIHDGAQQHLVALAVNLRLAQTLAERAPDRAAAVLAEQSVAAEAAVTALTSLSLGLYPPLLSAEGLVAALRAAAATSAVPVDVVAGDLPRLPGDMEVALYFCTLEALQNASKHADATRVVVTVESGDDGGVRLTVTDDGRGFDPTSAGAGTGLANMRDRMDSIGGRLLVESAPGEGARIIASVPHGG